MKKDEHMGKYDWLIKKQMEIALMTEVSGEKAYYKHLQRIKNE